MKKTNKNQLSAKTIQKSVYQSRKDIADWGFAKRVAQNAINPKFVLLQELYDDISNDALLSSQISNREESTISHNFELVDKDGNVDDDTTSVLRKNPIIQDLIKAILDSEFYGYSIVELSWDNIPQMTVLNRQNIDPKNARFYPDATGTSYINYRDIPEYGKFLLEFNSGHIGILNKTVPHILFKKFAQSCWSELCEIYGIPPRYVKTNTNDPAMLSRAECMLRDMGAAAAFVIDNTEEFQFANGVSTNGDVYNNLIRLCNNEVSMLISGAIMGQDTENGNYSKEQAAQDILGKLIESDKRMVEMYFNSVVLPAFISIGWLPNKDYTFRFSSVEDNQQLWQMVKDIMPYKEVDSKWITERFGIPVTEKSALTLSADNFFE